MQHLVFSPSFPVPLCILVFSLPPSGGVGGSSGPGPGSGVDTTATSIDSSHFSNVNAFPCHRRQGPRRFIARSWEGRLLPKIHGSSPLPRGDGVSGEGEMTGPQTTDERKDQHRCRLGRQARIRGRSDGFRTWCCVRLAPKKLKPANGRAANDAVRKALPSRAPALRG